MKKIEEIIEMMREINPDIKMDGAFKKSLKNKLEITSFAKIKNTKNKKINIAKSGFFSFRKTNKNIFEKPKFNFIKLLSPVFIGAFAVFGFVNFYGNNLFINNGKDLNNNFNYEVEKVEEANNSPIIPFHKGDEQVSSDIEEKIAEKKVIKKREIVIPKIKKIDPKKNSKKAIKKEKIKTNSLSTEGFSPLKKVEENNSINTEIIDLLGDGKENFNSNFNSVSKENNLALEASFDETSDASVFEVVPEIENINNFIKFCEDKKGIIKNNICEYENKKCSRKDFENKKCN